MKNLTLLFLLAGISYGVDSHEFLKQILVKQNLTDNANFISVTTFQLTEAEIDQLYHDEINITQNPSSQEQALITWPDNLYSTQIAPNQCSIGLPTCGMFDHFDMARIAARAKCRSHRDQLPGLYLNAPIPLYIGPVSFVNTNTGIAAAKHHTDYQLSLGLVFECGYFEMPVNNGYTG